MIKEVMGLQWDCDGIVMGFQGEFLQDVLTHLEHRTSHTQKKLEKGKKSIFTYLIIS